jgi:hypothetical protein
MFSADDGGLDSGEFRLLPAALRDEPLPFARLVIPKTSIRGTE